MSDQPHKSQLTSQLEKHKDCNSDKLDEITQSLSSLNMSNKSGLSPVNSHIEAPAPLTPLKTDQLEDISGAPIDISQKNRRHRKVLGYSSRQGGNNNGGIGSPNNSIHRDQPMIHNKLHCDQIKQRRASNKVLSKLGNDDLRSVKLHTELAETANGVRMLAKSLSKATIQLDVKAIMIVTKARDNSLTYLTREAVEWFFTRDRDIIVYVDKHLEKLKRFDVESLKKSYPNKTNKLLKYWDKKFALKNPEKIDLVVTLGGDGTVLFVSNLFQRIVPPVISFALGLLGFLTNFEFEQFRKRMSNVLESGVRAYLRMRFTCRVHKANGKLVCEQQVLNELVIDRGPSPYVTQLELYGDGSLLTVAQADGLIIATPTGSTAYSLSAGGSLVHPGVSAISVTPICPHTLSFRPILLPDGMFLKVKVPELSRSTAWASFDGKVRTELDKGDYVTIQASPFPFPTVISSKTEYIDSVSRNLNWNAREQQKPFTHLLSGPNKDRIGNDSTLEQLNRGGGRGQQEEDYDINYDDEDDDEELEDEQYRHESHPRRESNYTDSSVSTLPNHPFDDHRQDDYEEDDYEEEDYDHYKEYEDDPFIPSPGGGLNTPPPTNNLTSFGAFDDREYYAHPNARLALYDTAPSRHSSATSTETDGITISPKPNYQP